MQQITPLFKFTDDETFKMAEYLSKKADHNEKRGILLQQLEEVDAQIIEMQAGYGEIYNKRNPILRLPVEVTCLIFTYAQLPKVIDEADSSEEDEEDNEDNDEPLMEVVVSHVCRKWRTISLGFPKLWATFYFEADGSSDVPLQRFHAYLERSVNFPLRLWFDFGADSDQLETILLVEKAVELAHRWQHFTMYSSDETLIQPLRRLRNISVPMLEYFTLAPGIEFDDEGLDEAPLWDPLTDIDSHIFRGGAPKLTYLMLDGYSMRHALPPLSNVTILRIEKQQCDALPVFESTTFLDLLSLPSLNQLSLSGDLLEPFLVPCSIHMPNLKRFRVSEFCAIWHLLPSLRAPQLDTLIIHMCGSGSGFLAGSSPAPLDKGYSFPALHKLYIIDSKVEQSVAPAFTHVTSQVADVVISNEGLPTSLLQGIVDAGYEDVTWPRLKTLSCNMPAEGIVTYVAFAQSRPKGSFAFRFPPAMFENWEEGLAALDAIALVILDEEEWELDEPFWPQDLDLGPKFDFGKDDGFSIETYS